MRLSLLASLIGALLGAAVATAQSGPTGGGGLTTTTTTTPVTAPPPPSPPGSDPLKGRGMWIWELTSSNNGSVSSIAATARQYGVSTVIVKSSDGTGMWSQFTPQLIHAMHADGIKVCAWQYVYGTDPVGEATAGATAVRDGADCLM